MSSHQLRYIIHDETVWLSQAQMQEYTINQKRLAEKGITEAEHLLSLLKNTLANQKLVTDEGQVVLGLVNSYDKIWQMPGAMTMSLCLSLKSLLFH